MPLFARVAASLLVASSAGCRGGIEQESQHFAEQHAMRSYAQVLSLQLAGERRGAPRPPETRQVLAEMRAEFISACILRLTESDCQRRAREIESHAEEAQHWTVK